MSERNVVRIIGVVLKIAVGILTAVLCFLPSLSQIHISPSDTTSSQYRDGKANHLIRRQLQDPYAPTPVAPPTPPPPDGLEFRSYNGSRNNLAHPEWAAGIHFYLRTQNASYLNATDGTMFPDYLETDPVTNVSRFRKQEGRTVLPPARFLSNLVCSESKNSSRFDWPDGYMNPRGISDYVTFFGEWLSFDIMNSIATKTPSNLTVPKCDVFFDPDCRGNVTIPYRPLTGNQTANGYELETSASGFIDVQQIYGYTEERAKQMRSFAGGKFKMELIRNEETGVEGWFPPRNLDAEFPTQAEVPVKGRNTTSLFQLASRRNSILPQVQAFSVLWMREHNRLADELARQHPDWDDNRIFEEARKWVIAYHQKICYREYLPAVLGRNPIPAYQGYNESVNPTVDAFFSVAAFRYGHTEAGVTFPLIIYTNGKPHTLTAEIKHGFYNPDYISKYDLGPILHGMALQTQQDVDVFVAPSIRNYLFGELPVSVGGSGLDLAAVDIQRCREFGLPSYNEARKSFGLNPVTTFEEITSDPELANRLKEAYDGDVNLLEAYLGGLAEDHIYGGNLGPLFFASLNTTFTRLRDGDRFWYENQNISPAFSSEEIAAIQNTTYRDIILRNTNIPPEGLPRDIWYVHQASQPGESAPSQDLRSAYTHVRELAPGYRMFWRLNKDANNITIALQVDGNGWAGIAFPRPLSTMPGAHFIIASAPSETASSMFRKVHNAQTPNSPNFTVGEYSSSPRGFDAPVANSESGQMIRVHSIESTPNSITVQFSRPLILENQSSFVNIEPGVRRMLFAFNPNNPVLQYHGGNKGIALIDFYTDQNVAAVVAQPDDFTRWVHGIGMIILWTILYPIGIYFARFRKHKANWLPIHMNIQLLGSISVIALASAILSALNRQFRYFHAFLGTVIFGLVILQLILGFITAYGLHHYFGGHYFVRFIHRFHGRILVITAWVRPPSGTGRNRVGVTLEAAAADPLKETLESWYGYRKLKLRKQDNFTWQFLNQQVARGADLVVCKTFVLDIKNFIPVHPGGSEILTDLIGTDITNDFLDVPLAENVEFPTIPTDEVSNGQLGRRPSIQIPKMRTFYQLYLGFSHEAGWSESSDSYRQIPIARRLSHLHSHFAWEKMGRMVVGTLLPDETGNDPSFEFRRFTLQSKKDVVPWIEGLTTHRVLQLRYQVMYNPAAFGDEEKDGEVLPGQHFDLRVRVENEWYVRPYTPICGSLRTGFELLVKVYKEGIVSSFLDQQGVGCQVQARGETIDEEFSPEYRTKRIYLGITPAIQIIHYHYTHSLDTTMIHLIFANQRTNDIIASSYLDNLASQTQNHREFLTVDYVIEYPTPEWRGYKGYISRELIVERGLTFLDLKERGSFEAGKIIIIAGRDEMVENVRDILNEEQVPSEMVRCLGETA
ncbi:heme peroxidase [Paraphysoderma sedebokerense]|nr:heme peroxidase [Paraphysoderma sedebokerense]